MSNERVEVILCQRWCSSAAETAAPDQGTAGLLDAALGAGLLALVVPLLSRC